MPDPPVGTEEAKKLKFAYQVKVWEDEVYSD